MSQSELNREIAKMERRTSKILWMGCGFLVLILVLMAWRWEAHISIQYEFGKSDWVPVTMAVSKKAYDKIKEGDKLLIHHFPYVRGWHAA